MEETMGPIRNFGKYRTHLQKKKEEGPVIPWFGTIEFSLTSEALFIKDVTSVCEGNSTQPLEDKLELLGSQIVALQPLLKTPFKFQVDEVMTTYLNHLEKFTEDILTSISISLEKGSEMST
jgi:hypothetical protein